MAFLSFILRGGFCVVEKRLKITFWGVRGSRPVPGKDTVVYGGNTPCVTVEAGKTLIILDGGTGLCNLGNCLVETKKQVRAHIFITHTHWDHIQGFPFFTPAYLPGNELFLYGEGKFNQSFADLMREQMVYPHFPVQLEQMKGEIRFTDVFSGDRLEIEEGLWVSTVHNNHPGGCLSYRVDYGDRSCCYVTDTEHYACPDAYLRDFAADAGLVIYDSNFTDAEYAGTTGYNTKIGWGHSTWQEGIKFVQAANVPRLVLFHHATHRTDGEMLCIEKEAQGIFKGCQAAVEGQSIYV